MIPQDSVSAAAWGASRRRSAQSSLSRVRSIPDHSARPHDAQIRGRRRTHVAGSTEPRETRLEHLGRETVQVEQERVVRIRDSPVHSCRAPDCDLFPRARCGPRPGSGHRYSDRSISLVKSSRDRRIRPNHGPVAVVAAWSASSLCVEWEFRPDNRNEFSLNPRLGVLNLIRLR